jgi:hypothetical protein
LSDEILLNELYLRVIPQGVFYDLQGPGGNFYMVDPDLRQGFNFLSAVPFINIFEIRVRDSGLGGQK